MIKNSDTQWPGNTEQLVLGAIMLDSAAIEKIAYILESDDFFAAIHGMIYSGMLALRSRGDTVDQITLEKYLKKIGDLENLGVSGYLAKLVDAVPATGDAVQYAHAVRRMGAPRRLIKESAALRQGVSLLGFTERRKSNICARVVTVIGEARCVSCDDDRPATHVYCYICGKILKKTMLPVKFKTRK